MKNTDKLTPEDLELIGRAIMDGKIKLSYKIDLTDIDKDVLSKTEKYRIKESKLNKYFIISVASLLSIATITFFIYFYVIVGSAMVELSNKEKSVKSLALGNAVVSLNYDTKISYKQDTVSKILMVDLDHGEITINNPQGDYIQITAGDGLSFSYIHGRINFFHRNGYTSISSMDAEIVVKKNGEEYVLTPGQQLDFSSQAPLSIKQVKTSPGAWATNNVVSFSGRPLFLILEELQEKLEVTLQVDPNDPALEQIVTGTFSLDDKPTDILKKLFPEGYYFEPKPGQVILITKGVPLINK